MEVKDQIRSIRKKAGLTQQQLADLFGKKRACVTHWETGRTSPPLKIYQEILKIQPR